MLLLRLHAYQNAEKVRPTQMLQQKNLSKFLFIFTWFACISWQFHCIMYIWYGLGIEPRNNGTILLEKRVFAYHIHHTVENRENCMSIDKYYNGNHDFILGTISLLFFFFWFNRKLKKRDFFTIFSPIKCVRAVNFSGPAAFRCVVSLNTQFRNLYFNGTRQDLKTGRSSFSVVGNFSLFVHPSLFAAVWLLLLVVHCWYLSNLMFWTGEFFACMCVYE